ncbi:hypothetical protein SK128_007011 [Halocaridina rubra]|uniref:C2H2-type domain-containing protein n=1 Tax=Halocaridina rubra TaxID=373956 RepID=A0AAN9ADR1_HALRR
MSGREGTRRKKISALHMLGIWEDNYDSVKSSTDLEQNTDSDIIDKESVVKKIGIQNYIQEAKRTSEVTIINTKDTENLQNVCKEKKMTNIKQEVISEDMNTLSYNEEEPRASHDDEASYKTVRKANIQSGENHMSDVNIKQEPLDFMSDEDDLEEIRNTRKNDNWSCHKSKKRAKMVTSEVENIYAKPRMVFTGRGLVKKYEPGLDKTPKSKRGRKPNKNVAMVSVKQESKESEEKEAQDLEQLQQALSEAADNLDMGDELLDAFDEFQEEPKEAKVKRKAKFRVVKRVDAEGDKYVECNMCFKMLKESSMKQHYKTHTGEKPHGCDECDARFTRKGDVERHKRLVHKNMKPFNCRKCKRSFSDRKNLKLHLQNHDKAVYYACNTCRFKFGKREYYENHIRYIHPLPDGSVPIFSDVETDPVAEQLLEIETEEKKEKNETETPNADEPVLQVEKDIRSVKNEDEEAATEITVTDNSHIHENVCESSKDASEELETNDSAYKKEDNMNLEETEEVIDRKLSSVQKPQVSTDVKVSKGTLSYTQTLCDVGSRDEDLVKKAIDDAISQAANTIESLQSLAGANLSGSGVEFEDDDDEDDILEEDEDDDAAFQQILESYDIIPVSVEQKADQLAEIHIMAAVGGVKKKFIIQVPSGSNLNIQSQEGMEMIVNMINQLCAGKGEIDGPIEVVMHQPNSKPVALE